MAKRKAKKAQLRTRHAQRKADKNQRRARSARERNAFASRSRSADLGGSLLDFVFEQMQIDDGWSVRKERSFTWWGHQLAQRVWADPPRQSFGESIVCLRAETDLLRGVPNTPTTLAAIAAMNQFASLNALVFDPEAGNVSLSCNVNLYEGNLWLRQIFATAVALQAANAHTQAEGLAELLGGEPARSEHPSSGERVAPDDMLGMAAFFASDGEDASPFTEADFASVLETQPQPWLVATGDGAGLKAEFAFDNGSPASVRIASDEPHPGLGSGCLFLLHLPMTFEPDVAAKLANELNATEAREWSAAHLLGAWCSRERNVSFASFLPAAVARSKDPSSRQALVFNLILTMARRAKWAHEQGALGSDGD